MPTDIRYETIELPTYETGPESPNPWFTKRLGAHPYPYRLQNRLTGKRAVRAHDAVILESEYLRLTFLPDFGCRLFSAYDKLLSREIFYRNDCVKPALIAIRGAWISGGVEFNFPVSHSIYTHSRIPHTTRQSRDGSASLIFGLTEQMTGMRFTVEVILAPGEYRFSARIRLYNGTPLPQRHYWWTNAAVRLTEQTQMIYPMTLGISGRYGEKTSWPVHEGVDLSMAWNHPSAGDVFARETYDDFFGVYHHDLGCGVAHWARQDELPARKMFFWGRDGMGELSQRRLTEDAGDYLEIQAGRFATQSDFDFLMPCELAEMTEFWIPVGRTAGYVKAHRQGIINVTSDGRVAVQMALGLDRGKMRFLDDSSTAKEFTHVFEAGAVYWFDAPVSTEKLGVQVFDSAGTLVLEYDATVKDKVRHEVPRTHIMPGRTETPAEILQAARVYARIDSPATAHALYEKLAGTEHEIEARKGLARLALLAGKYVDAREHISGLPDDDPEALYYHALATEDPSRAEGLWQSLLGSEDYDIPARRHLATEAVKRNDHAQAFDLCRSDMADPLLLLISAVSARKLGDADRARAVIAALQADDPLFRPAEWEALFLDPDAAIGMDIEAFQEDTDAAAWYLDLEMRDESRAIVEAWSLAGAPDDPLLDTLAAQLGVIPKSGRRKDQRGVASCFAHGDTLARLLQDQADPAAHVHLANMLYARGRTDEAIAAWEKAREARIPDHTPYRNLALAYWQRKDDPNTAYEFMREAGAVSPTDPDTLRDLDVLAELAGRYDDRPDIADRILRNAQDSSPCLERAVRVLLEVGRFDEAVELLTTRKFFVAELAYQTRILYVRALLERGSRSFNEGAFEAAASDFRAAAEYPESLGAGRIHGSSDAQAHYLLGLALTRLGRTSEAPWMLAADDEPVRGTEQAYYVGMARKRLGRRDAKDALDAIVPVDASADADQARARHQYLLGLSALSEGKSDESARHFKEARGMEAADPVKMHNHLEAICYTYSEGRRVPIPVWWTVEPAETAMEDDR